MTIEQKFGEADLVELERVFSKSMGMHNPFTVEINSFSLQLLVRNYKLENFGKY